MLLGPVSFARPVASHGCYRCCLLLAANKFLRTPKTRSPILLHPLLHFLFLFLVSGFRHEFSSDYEKGKHPDGGFVVDPSRGHAAIGTSDNQDVIVSE
jgi:hypothetical protein